MPGSRESCLISRPRASFPFAISSLAEEVRRQVEPAGDRAHLLLNAFAYLESGVAERGEHEVLQHLDVARIDRLRRDGDLRHDELAVDLHPDHIAAGGSYDGNL